MIFAGWNPLHIGIFVSAIVLTFVVLVYVVWDYFNERKKKAVPTPVTEQTLREAEVLLSDAPNERLVVLKRGCDARYNYWAHEHTESIECTHTHTEGNCCHGQEKNEVVKEDDAGTKTV